MIKLIAHRGLTDGPDHAKENNPEHIINITRAEQYIKFIRTDAQIEATVSFRYDVEIDLWYVDNELYLGHDKPTYKIDSRFLYDIYHCSWIHCKNLEALEWCQNARVLAGRYSNLNYFWHNEDQFTITSRGYIWPFPDYMAEGAVINQPEWKLTGEITNDILKSKLEDFSKNKSYIGICSKYVRRYREILGI